MLIGFFASIIEFGYLVMKEEIITPIWFYENSEMNWLGCWTYFILLSIFSPFMLAWKIVFFTIACIYNFLDWLFHVGRKDDE
jgi:hypothetical protein